MKKLIIVIDMQNDFVGGCLGSKEAIDIVPNMVNYLTNNDVDIIFTRDTHQENYMETLEGKNLPVKHCIENTTGWEIIDELKPFVTTVFNKPTFGSIELAKYVTENNYDEIELMGVCTGICVISNALLLKANLPEANISINSSLCACVTPDSHNTALEAMKLCQINIK